MSIRRGDIYYADLAPVVGSEQGGTRPVLIIQNDMGNRHSPTVIAAAITSRQGKKPNVINLIKNCVYNQQNILKNFLFLKKFCFFL